MSSFEIPCLLSERINSKLDLELDFAAEINESEDPNITLFFINKPDSNFNATSTLSSKETVGLISSPIANRVDNM